MGATAAVVGAVATVAGVGMSAYNTFGSSKPSIGAPPPPANYYTYDEDGNLAGSQVWDASQNAYIYRPAELTPEQKAEKAKRQELRTQMLSNLGATPEDRVKAYNDYAGAISKSLHRDVDFQYNKMVTSQNEGMAARGLLGSRAYVDAQAELNRQKTLADTDIANRAELGKENLSQQDRSYWLNILSALDSQQNASAAVAANNARTIQSGGEAASPDLLGGYNAYNGPQMRQWQTQQALKSRFSESDMNNTATGLAFLYGFNKGTGTSLNSPSVSSPNLTPNPTLAYANYLNSGGFLGAGGD